MIVRAAPPEHFSWIADRAGLVPGGGFHALEAVDASGRIHGMVGFDGWTPNAVALHVAIDHPAALRHLIRPSFAIAFESFGRSVVVATVLSANTKSLRLVRHLGFREVMRGRDWWAPGVDMVWHEMRREECRWLEQSRRAA